MAEYKVDSIQVKLEDVSSGAGKNIDKMVSSLERLKAAATGVNGVASATVGVLNNLKNASQGIGTDGSENIKAFTSIMKELSSTNISKASQSIWNGLSKIAKGANEFSKESVAGLSSMTDSIKQLSETELSNIKIPPTLPKRLAEIAESVKSIESDDIAKLDSVAASLQRLSGVDLSGVGSALRGITELRNRAARRAAQTAAASAETAPLSGSEMVEGQTYTQGIEEANRSALSLRERMFEMRLDIKEARSEYRSLLKEMSKQNQFTSWDLSSLTEARKQVEALTSAYSELNSSGEVKFSDKIEVGAMLVKKALTDKFAPAISMGTGLLNSFASAAKKAGNSLISNFASKAKSAGKSILSGISSPLNSVTTQIDNIKRSISRIAFYRAVRFAIKAVTDSFTVGINNLYEYSKLTDTKFAPAMNQLATSLQYLQNSIGAVAAPIIEVLAPAIDMLVDKFVDLINVAGKATAALTGKDVYTQAKKQAVEYTGAASKAAKATKAFTLSIDELNILDPTSDSSSTAADYASMFEDVEAPAETADWAAQVKKAIEEGDWYGVGTVLADKFNTVVESFPAAEFGNKLGVQINRGLSVAYGLLSNFDFKNVGKNLADGLNSVLYTVDFNLLGKTLGANFNATIDTALGFVEDFKFAVAGEKIADAINGMFSEVHWDNLGKLANDGVLGVISSIDNAILFTDFGAIGNDFATMLNQIEWGDIIKNAFITVGDAFEGALDFAIGFISNYDFSKLANGITKGVVEGITQIDWISIAVKLGAFQLNMLKTLYVDIGNGIITGLLDVMADTFRAFGQDTIAGFIQGASDKLKELPEFIQNKFVNPLIEKVQSLLGIHSPSTVMAEIGGFLVQGLYNGVTGAWAIIPSFFKTKLTEIKNEFSSKWNDITSGTKTSFSNMKSETISTFSSMKTSVSDIFTSMWSNIKGVINSIIGGVETMGNGVVKGLNGVIRAMNKLNFSIPDWIPEYGGKSFGFNLSTISEIKIPKLASGGFVDKGQLFVANEVGAELVGNIGNKTAVVNNAQIVEGISAGVEDANEEVVNAILAMTQQIITAIRENKGDVYIDGDKVGSKTTSTQNRQNRIFGKTLQNT